MSLSDIEAKMNIFRIALANLRFPRNADESVKLAEQAIADASIGGAGVDITTATGLLSARYRPV